ncbi:TolC family outer membrane protein [Pseudomonas faucium]|uniref:TolC family outer membrane protein n=1 Tax=Pseudomonas faucium TaxID=2740518 RepID=UPI001F4709AF|nr:TolC family outer membrane protein [Pseudomonas faucium]
MIHSSSLATVVDYSIRLLLATCSASSYGQGAVNLLDIHASALANNAQLSADRHAYGAHRERVAQAMAGLLPSLNLGAHLQSTRTLGTEVPLAESRQGTLYRATLNQPLFRLDRWYALEAARAGNWQSRLALDAQEQALILECTTAYFETLRAQDTLAATRAEAQAIAGIRNQVSARLRQGAANRLDVLDAQATYDLAAANTGLAERKAQDALAALGKLTGKPVIQLAGLGHDDSPLVPVPKQADAWVSQALTDHPALQADNYAIDAARHEHRQRKAAHAPTLDAVLGYSYGAPQRFGLTGSQTRGPGQRQIGEQTFSLELNIPLFNGGFDISRTRESAAVLAQREDEWQERQRKVVLNVRNLHRAVMTDFEQLNARLYSVRSSLASLDANTLGQQLGTRNIADVMDAQKRYYSAVRQYNDARYDLLINHFKLLEAAGALNHENISDVSSRLLPTYKASQHFAPDKQQIAKLISLSAQRVTVH